MFHTHRIYCLLVLCLTIFQQAQSINKPAFIQRACLNRADSVLTVSFVGPATDACASFTNYELYGRDNTANPFVSLGKSSNFLSTQIQCTLPNKKQWQVFITLRFACNGTDTFNTDTIQIDDVPPAYLEPDSVSVDLFTQTVIAGWPKAPEKDVMGYSLFKSDPSNGNNLLIDKTQGLFYSFNTSTFDPNNTGNRYRMAAYDSCNNGGPISSYHSPILLKLDIDPTGTNHQCSRKLFIKWDPYVGWAVNGYDIFVKDDISNSWSIVGSVPGNQYAYIYPFSNLGAKYSFYVRAHKTSSTITSSSNIITFTTVAHQTPANIEIGHVSVISNSGIEITSNWEAAPSIKNVLLQLKPFGSSTWTTLATYAGSISKAKFTDFNKNTSTQKYNYRLLATNTCDEPFDSSNAHTSILLRRLFNELYWNGYWGWQSSPSSEELEEREKQSSTWNKKTLTQDSLYLLTDTTSPNCYRIIAIKYNTNTAIDTAYSNEICLKSFDSTLIPSAFTPGGINPIFKIINSNLLPGQATMFIYNRWGEKIFEGDALKGWDGTDSEGEYVGPSIYPYIVQIVRTEKRELFKGTITVIR